MNKNNSTYNDFNTKLETEIDELVAELDYRLLTRDIDNIILTVEEI